MQLLPPRINEIYAHEPKVAASLSSVHSHEFLDSVSEAKKKRMRVIFLTWLFPDSLVDEVVPA